MGFDIDVPSLEPIGGGGLPNPTIPDVVREAMSKLEIRTYHELGGELCKPLSLGSLETNIFDQYFFLWVNEINTSRAFTLVNVSLKSGAAAYLTVTRLYPMGTRIFWNGTLKYDMVKNLYPYRGPFEGTVLIDL